ncbi:MAG TPA: hypothetical protein PKJ43_06690 [Prolixibacteraceae bacterium]|nr:hypothetical protein [Prolixibacteraceae bacterium]
MVVIRFTGWRVGMRPILFIKLLHVKAKLSLVESKRIKDRIVDENEIVEVKMNSEKNAIEILNEAKELGVIGELIIQ